MSMSTPAITLITDFGLQDGHVGAMKGVMRTIAPNAELVDISHHIPPQDIRHGGFVLMTAYAFWPPDTIHVIVVDPGVGTDRRAIAVQTAKGTFVAPDNGVLSYVLAQTKDVRSRTNNVRSRTKDVRSQTNNVRSQDQVSTVIALTNPAYWHHPVSPSFHGRDIFGPAAAHLANGVPLTELGKVIAPESLSTFFVPVPRRHLDGHITAHVQHIDRFGNCITDMPGDSLSVSPRGQPTSVRGQPTSVHWRIEAKEQTILGIKRTFGDVPEGQAVALVDSTGFLAIAVRNGSAAQTMNLKAGDPVDLWPLRS